MNPPARWHPLVLLTVVVLAAHVLLLQTGAPQLQPPDPLALRTLVTRTIVASTQAGRVEPAPAAAPRQARAPALRAPAPERQPDEAAVVSQALKNRPTPETASTQAQAAAEPARAPRESSAPSLALAVPGSTRLQYKVTAFARSQRWEARGELDWRHDGTTYDARLEVSMPFLPTRTQRSTGQITTEGLAPTRFSDKSRSEEAAHFERDKGKVIFSSNRPEVPLLAGAQDRLSVFLQLASLIGGDPAKFGTGSSITVQTASTRDAEPWIFTVQDEEQLQLPGGTLAALKIVRNPRREYDLKVELWLAPGMDYVPVRLRLTQANGDWVDQQWSATDRP